MLYKFKKVDGVCFEFEPIGVDIDGEWVEFDCDVEPINEPYHSHNYEMIDGVVRKRSDADIAAEDEANRLSEETEAAEQIAQPTIEEQLQDLSEYVDVLTEMVLGGAE